MVFITSRSRSQEEQNKMPQRQKQGERKWKYKWQSEMWGAGTQPRRRSQNKILRNKPAYMQPKKAFFTQPPPAPGAVMPTLHLLAQAKNAALPRGHWESRDGSCRRCYGMLAARGI